MRPNNFPRWLGASLYSTDISRRTGARYTDLIMSLPRLVAFLFFEGFFPRSWDRIALHNESLFHPPTLAQ